MDKHRALMAVSEINDMGHDLFFPWSDRNIKAYAYYEGSGTKLELERLWSCHLSLFHTARVRQRTALQVRDLHFLLWNRSKK